ncbi:MAG TPA: anhydro-N-acetylmuramic acid kinase [Cellvibrio sp.]|nr:anhydro-N-acetylmuramic acid kinase [Cellvibrio sp.]
MSGPAYYIGLMSGTSADAVDVVAVDFEGQKPHLIGSHSAPLPHSLRQQIYGLATPSYSEIDSLGELDQALGELFASTINELLAKYQLPHSSIAAIGSHGQTIRHRPPPRPLPFTLQIGDPNVIAERTGITTIADFRRRDMAAGGQGAPLVPAFHRDAFQSSDGDRVIVNIGGMANITWLPKQGAATGFDTGPGNVLMDAWILKNQQKNYDADGAWAASGKPDPALLTQLLKHPFLSLPPPKSTGREAFNLEWLESEIRQLARPVSAEDIQMTLLALTATSIADCISSLTTGPCEIIVCGGGAYNSRLLAELQQLLPGGAVVSSASLGIAPDRVEAIAFAWLAKQTLNRQSGNLSAVTGAQREVILGGIYFA